MESTKDRMTHPEFADPMKRLLTFWMALTASTAIFSLPASAGEPPTAPVLRIEAGMHTAKIKRISADRAGRLALTVSYDKTARLWELPSGRLLRIFRPPVGAVAEGKLFACALSPDGTLAAVGGWTGYEWDGNVGVYLFDTATGQMVRRLTGLPNVIEDLAFSQNGRFLAAGIQSGGGVRVWETEAWKEVGRDIYPADCYGVDWQGDEKLVSSCDDGNLRLYKLSSAAFGTRFELLRKAPVQGGNQPCAVRFSPEGNRIAIGFDDSTKVTVVDGSTLAFLYAPDTSAVDNGNLMSVAWSTDGRLFAGGMWGKDSSFSIREWRNGGRGPGRNDPAGSTTIMDLRALPNGGILFATNDPAWGVLDANGRRTLLRGSPVADYKNDQDGFRVSTDGTEMAFGFANSGRDPARFSVVSRELSLLPKGAALPASLHAARREGLPIADWQDSGAPKLAGKLLPMEKFEPSRCLAIQRDASGFLLGAEWYLRSFTAGGNLRWQIPAPDATWEVNLATGDQLTMAAFGDGTIRWYRTDSGRELLAFFPHADRKRWVMWTPQGYYDCSPGAEDLIGWQVNRGKDHEADFFPASKFHNQFYRPDVIQRVLRKGDISEALKEADEASGRKSQSPAQIEQVVAKMQPPTVELTVGGAHREVEVNAGETQFTVRYRVTRNTAEPVTKMRVIVDGRPTDIEAPIPANDTAEAGASVPLPSQGCVVAVLAMNRFAASEAAEVKVVRKEAPGIAAIKPKLYLFAAGIAHYKNRAQLPDLAYPPKDAKDFAAAFQRQEGGLYQKVEARVISENNATAGDILDGLEWIQHETTSKDVAVVFLSGHGDNDPEGRFYFCGQDYDRPRQMRTGVSFEQIQKTVASVAGKVLFFIDCCHAGNALGKLYVAKGVGGGPDVNALANELSTAENGAVVFASSTGRQQSLESDEWKNGAFTKAIVEGLDGEADFFKNGKITISGLETYLAERVKTLTEGQQTPTVAKPQTVPDYPIAIRR